MRTKASDKLLETGGEMLRLMDEFASIYDSLILNEGLSTRSPASTQRLRDQRRRLAVIAELIDTQMSMMLCFLPAADNIKVNCKIIAGQEGRTMIESNN